MADIIFRNTEEKKPSFPPLEAGTYPARCFAIVNVGSTLNEQYDKMITYIYFGFEIPSEIVTVGGLDSPRTIWGRYTYPGTHERAKLRQMLEQWRGKAFTDAEIFKGFPLSKILGTPCLLTLTADVTPGGTIFNHIGAVGKIIKGMKVDVPISDQIMFNIQAPEEDLKNLEKLPSFLQERVRESNEYKERTEEKFEDDSPIAADEEDLPF